MSSLSIPGKSQGTWIHPGIQLKKLASPWARNISSVRQMIPDLSEIASLYALDGKLIEWYTGLEKIGQLPEKIPPLPENIEDILNAPCPRFICSQKKENGTFYTVGEKCSLTLIPQALKTIQVFEETIQEKQADPDLKLFEFFHERVRREFKDMPFTQTHWELRTDEPLEGSFNLTFKKQKSLIQKLKNETSENWEIPDLQGTLVTTFLKQITNGPAASPYTYTRVKERVVDYYSVAAGSTETGVFCHNLLVHTSYPCLGIMAVKKFF